MAEKAATLKIEDAQFIKALHDIARTDRKEYKYVMNDQAIRFAFDAIKHTKAATPARIEKDLDRRQIVAHQVFSKSGKRLKKSKRIKAKGTLAERLINAKRRDAGKPLLWGSDMEQAVSELKKARRKSSAYIKAGWLPGSQILMRANRSSKAGIRSGRTKQHGRGHGTAKSARAAVVSQCSITNFLKRQGKHWSNPGNPYPIAQAGARRAIVTRTADMKRKLTERLNRNHAKYQGR
jgi:hypothetical protein